MVINRSPAEWFDFRDRSDEEVYGVLKTGEGWAVLRKEADIDKVSVIAQVDSRKTAIGFIKLLLEK
jgi:hypothetical protein